MTAIEHAFFADIEKCQFVAIVDHRFDFARRHLPQSQHRRRTEYFVAALAARGDLIGVEEHSLRQTFQRQSVQMKMHRRIVANKLDRMKIVRCIGNGIAALDR